MSFKRFDPFRYSVDTVSPVVRKDLARMTVPELPANELEPPAALKVRLGTLSNEHPAGPPPAPLPTLAPETPRTLPSASPPTRRLSKAVVVALGVALASLAAALLRS